MTINERCPLQSECERPCIYTGYEINCRYYYANAREGYYISDQEALRKKLYAERIVDTETEMEPTTLPTIVLIPTDRIFPHPDNPRKDVGDVSELAESIKVNGILQNLTVVPSVDNMYTVIIGHRRLAAAKLAGLEMVPCAIVEMSPKEQVSTMLTENMQRVDLTVVEQAQGFQMMLDLGDTVDEIADKSGFSKTTVKKRLEIARLDPVELQKTAGRQLTIGDFDALTKVEDIAERNRLLQSIGTPNFNNALSSALQQQRVKKRIEEWLVTVRTFATEITAVDHDTMTYCCNYSWYNIKSEVSVPADAQTVKYYYRLTDRQIDIYKERDASREAADVAAREEKRRQTEERQMVFEDISSRHFDLRCNFVKQLSNALCKSHLCEISAFLANVKHSYDTYIDVELLGFCLGVKVDNLEDDDGNGLLTNITGIRSASEAFPEKLIFCLAYTVDTYRNGYWKRVWENGQIYFIHRPNSMLDMIYQMLVLMGYEMSDEELAMQNGTSELFSKDYPATR